MKTIINEINNVMRFLAEEKELLEEILSSSDKLLSARKNMRTYKDLEKFSLYQYGLLNTYITYVTLLHRKNVDILDIIEKYDNTSEMVE